MGASGLKALVSGLQSRIRSGRNQLWYCPRRTLSLRVNINGKIRSHTEFKPLITKISLMHDLES